MSVYYELYSNDESADRWLGDAFALDDARQLGRSFSRTIARQVSVVELHDDGRQTTVGAFKDGAPLFWRHECTDPRQLQAQAYTLRAEELRRVAAETKSQRFRKELQSLAEEWERLATWMLLLQQEDRDVTPL